MKYTMVLKDLVKITFYFMHLTCENFEFVTIDLLVDSKNIHSVRLQIFLFVAVTTFDVF